MNGPEEWPGMREVPPPPGDDERAASPGDERPLPFVDLALPLKPRGWLVHERIPTRNVTILSGEAAAGKSTLLMQLAGSTALGKGWIGMYPDQGPALYVSCEEDHDETRRRLEDVAVPLGSTREELAEGGLRVLSFAGLDAILGEPERSGVIRPTRLFRQIRAEAVKLQPKLIVIDTVADTFGGDEIKRAQARQFVTMLRGLAIAANAAVVLAAHPSVAGIQNDTGLSGSTGWANSVRARAYFKAGPHKALRSLEFRKNNYGPADVPPILLRWQDGVYVVDPGGGSAERLLAEAAMDDLFLTLLRRFAGQRRTVSDKPSPTYAPAVFVDEPEAKAAKATRKAFTEAMARLFAAEKLRAVPFGPPSKLRSRILENTTSNAFQRPSNAESAFQPPCQPASENLPTPSENDFQRPSNVFQLFEGGCASNPSLTPPPLERGREGGLRPPSRAPTGVPRRGRPPVHSGWSSPGRREVHAVRQRQAAPGRDPVRGRAAHLACGMRRAVRERRGAPGMRRVGEFATVTSRGNPIIRVVWERPCEVCGAPFRFSLPAGCPPEAANGYTTTCFAHSADKRARKAKRTARARHRSPSRKRHRRAPP